MPLYYYDEQGYKVGPIKKQELFTLAENGKIAPETRLTDGTNETKAKHVSGLKFIAPEYHRAEEIFDPKNYNLDTPTTISDNIQTMAQTYQPYSEKQKNVLPKTIPTHRKKRKQANNIPTTRNRQQTNIIIITLLSVIAITSTLTCIFVVTTIIQCKQQINELNQIFEDFSKEIRVGEKEQKANNVIQDIKQENKHNVQKHNNAMLKENKQELERNMQKWQNRAKEQFNAGASRIFDKSLDLHSKLQLELGVPFASKFQLPENRQLIIKQIKEKDTWDITVISPNAENKISSKQVKGKFEKYKDGLVWIQNGKNIDTYDIKYLNPFEQSLIGLYQEIIGQPIQKINR